MIPSRRLRHPTRQQNSLFRRTAAASACLTARCGYADVVLYDCCLQLHLQLCKLCTARFMIQLHAVAAGIILLGKGGQPDADRLSIPASGAGSSSPLQYHACLFLHHRVLILHVLSVIQLLSLASCRHRSGSCGRRSRHPQSTPCPSPLPRPRPRQACCEQMMCRGVAPDRGARQGAHTSRQSSLQVDGDLQSFRQDALELGQHEAGTPDADDGVVER